MTCVTSFLDGQRLAEHHLSWLIILEPLVYCFGANPSAPAFASASAFKFSALSPEPSDVF